MLGLGRVLRLLRKLVGGRQRRERVTCRVGRSKSFLKCWRGRHGCWRRSCFSVNRGFLKTKHSRTFRSRARVFLGEQLPFDSREVLVDDRVAVSFRDKADAVLLGRCAFFVEMVWLGAARWLATTYRRWWGKPLGDISEGGGFRRC